MVAQTSYSINHDRAYPGQIADLQMCEKISRPVALTQTAGINFGVIVSIEAAAGTVTPGGTNPIGITFRSLDRENGRSVAGETTAPLYGPGEAAGIMRKGYIYAELTGTGNIGADIFFVNATGALGIGTAGAGQTQIAGASLEEVVTTAGSIALIRIPDNAFTL